MSIYSTKLVLQFIEAFLPKEYLKRGKKIENKDNDRYSFKLKFSNFKPQFLSKFSIVYSISYVNLRVLSYFTKLMLYFFEIG